MSAQVLGEHAVRTQQAVTADGRAVNVSHPPDALPRVLRGPAKARCDRATWYVRHARRQPTDVHRLRRVRAAGRRPAPRRCAGGVQPQTQRARRCARPPGRRAVPAVFVHTSIGRLDANSYAFVSRLGHIAAERRAWSCPARRQRRSQPSTSRSALRCVCRRADRSWRLRHRRCAARPSSPCQRLGRPLRRHPRACADRPRLVVGHSARHIRRVRLPRRPAQRTCVDLASTRCFRGGPLHPEPRSDRRSVAGRGHCDRAGDDAAACRCRPEQTALAGCGKPSRGCICRERPAAPPKPHRTRASALVSKAAGPLRRDATWQRFRVRWAVSERT